MRKIHDRFANTVYLVCIMLSLAAYASSPAEGEAASEEDPIVISAEIIAREDVRHFLRPLKTRSIQIQSVAGERTVSIEDLLTIHITENEKGLVLFTTGGEELRGTSASKLEGISASREEVSIALSDVKSVCFLRDVAELCFLRGHEGGRVLSVDFSPDGKFLVSSGYDKKIVLWEIQTGKLKEFLRAPEIQASGLFFSPAFSPDGTILLLPNRYREDIGYQANMYRWDMKKKILEEYPISLAKMPGSTIYIKSMEFSPNGKFLIVVTNIVTVWNVETGQRADAWQEGISGYTASLSPDGKTLAIGQNTIRFYDFENAELLDIWQGESDIAIVQFLAFSPHGETLAASLGYTIYLWDVETHELLQTYEELDKRYMMSHFVFSNDGRRLICPYASKIYHWDVETGNILRISYSPYGVGLHRFSPDRRFMAVASDGVVRIYSVE